MESVFRASMNKQGITDNRFDAMLADAYEELFGLRSGSRIGSGERRAQTELRAVGDEDALIAAVKLLEFGLHLLPQLGDVAGGRRQSIFFDLFADEADVGIHGVGGGGLATATVSAQGR